MKTLTKDFFSICFALAATGCLLLTGCGEDRSGGKPKIANLSDLNRAECVIGGELGTLSFNTAEQQFPKATFHSFNLCIDVYPALAAGKIDAMVFDRPAMEYAALNYPEFVILPENLAQGKISVGAPLNKTELMAKVNAFIAQYKRDGTYQKMYDRWVRTKNSVMPELPEAANPTGTLRIGVTGNNQPMSFVADGGKLTGFDIEFAHRLALSLNMKCQLVHMDFHALFVACASGKIDLAVANMDATEERSKSMLFSDYYIESPIAAMIRKKDYAVSPSTENRIAVLEDLRGKRLGVMTGTTMDTLAAKKFQDSIIVYGNKINDLAIMAKTGKIDAFLITEPESLMLLPQNPELKRIGPRLSNDDCAFIFARNEAELRTEFSREIRRMKQNGLLDELQKKWFVPGDSNKGMPVLPDSAPRGELKYAVDPHTEPFCYLRDGKVVGYDVEIAERAAANLGYRLTPVIMDWGGYLASVASGKVRMGLGCTAITEERKQKILFSEPNYKSGIVVVTTEAAAGTCAGEPSGENIRSLADLKGKKAASLTGAGFQRLTDPLQSGIEHVFFNDNHSSVAALRVGKVDAVLLDKPVTRMFASRFPEDTRFVCVYAKDYYGFAFRKGSPLTERASAVIRELKKSGEMEKFAQKWLGGGEAELAVWTHKKDFDGSAGVLRYASDPTLEPMCYTNKNGNPVGLDVEVMRRIAYELNMEFKFVSTNFGSLIEALPAGKTDAVGGAMSITEERKKRVDFAECYYEGGLSILAGKQAGNVAGITDFSQLAGKKVGILSGTTLDAVIKEKLPRSTPIYFNAFTDLPAALNAGKIDAFLMEQPQFKLLQKQYPSMTALPQQLSHDEYAFVFSKQNQILCDEISKQIRDMKADGTLKKLDDYWFSGDSSAPPVPIPNLKPPKGTLRFAVVPQMEPFAFMREGKPVGYDLDVARIAAARMGYVAIPVIMDFSAVIEAVSAGKVDFGASCITITEERKRRMLFSEPDYRGGIVAVVMSAQNKKPETASFLNSLKDSFERTFLVENRWKLILDGLKITVIITVLAAIFGTLLAFPVCFLRRSKNRIPKWLGGLYVSLLQGTPILVILMLLYYVVFAKCDIDAVIVAVIGFGLNFAAYAGEMLRTGIDAVPNGQIEAAKALSLTRFQTFRKVVFPQAARQILPVYRGEFINMLKTTSIVGYIAIQDLTKMSDIIRSRTYEAFFPLIATAAIYFAAAWLLASVLSYFEYRLTPGRKGGLLK